jgi:hypothetical protein
LSGWGGGDGEPVSSVGLRHDFDDERWIDVDSDADADEVVIEDDAPHYLRALSDAAVEIAADPRLLSRRWGRPAVCVRLRRGSLGRRGNSR